MKLATKPSAVSAPTADPLLTGAKAHFLAASEALRKGCAEALITGMHLIALHSCTTAGHGGLRLAGELSGFNAALTEIGIADTTARRWMNAVQKAGLRTCLIMDGDNIADHLPDHDTPAWARWENEMRKLADGMSLSRLMLGQVQDSTEDHRYEKIISSAEDGSSNAEALLLGVADGKYTLAQAVKALGSLEAYKKLEEQGTEKIRRDPVYLDYDPISKRPIGLLPKAFVTLSNGFQQWETYDSDARHEMHRQWLEVVKTVPRELSELLRK